MIKRTANKAVNRLPVLPTVSNNQVIGFGDSRTSFVTEQTNATSAFTASISGTTMTVSNVSSGSIMIGGTLTGGDVAGGTYVKAFVSGTQGGVGTYTISASGATSATGQAATIFPDIRRATMRGYLPWLLHACKAKCKFVGNYGINGTTLTDMTTRLTDRDKSGFSRANILGADPGKTAGIVVFLGGVNDGNWQLTGTNATAPKYDAILTGLLDAGKIVIICNELPNNNVSGQGAANYARRQYLDTWPYLNPATGVTPALAGGANTAAWYAARVIHANTYDQLADPNNIYWAKPNYYATKKMVGTVTVSGTAVNGSGTSFTTDISSASANTYMLLDSNYSLIGYVSSITNSTALVLASSPTPVNGVYTGCYAVDCLHASALGFRVFGEYIGRILNDLLAANGYPNRAVLPSVNADTAINISNGMLSGSLAITATNGETAGAGGANMDGNGGVGISGNIPTSWVADRGLTLPPLLNAAQPVAGNQLTIVCSMGTDSEGFSALIVNISGMLTENGNSDAYKISFSRTGSYTAANLLSNTGIVENDLLYCVARIKINDGHSGLSAVGTEVLFKTGTHSQTSYSAASNNNQTTNAIKLNGMDSFDKIIISPPITAIGTADAGTLTVAEYISITLLAGININATITISRVGISRNI